MQKLPLLSSKNLKAGSGGARWSGPKRLDDGRGVGRGAAGRSSRGSGNRASALAQRGRKDGGGVALSFRSFWIH